MVQNGKSAHIFPEVISEEKQEKKHVNKKHHGFLSFFIALYHGKHVTNHQEQLTCRI